jgi:hypothetical protein
MHSVPHPQAGKYYRINIDDGSSPAGYDQMLHGSLFQLLDWADRLDNYDGHTSRQKEVALMFYAHRCLPDLPVTDPFRPEDVPLDGLVFGSTETENHYPGLDSKVYRSIAVLHESVLYDDENH